MVAFFSTLLRLFFQVFRSRRTILFEISLLKKENEILLKKMGKKKVHFGFYDKLFLVVHTSSGSVNEWSRSITGSPCTSTQSWKRKLHLKRTKKPKDPPGDKWPYRR